MSVKKNPFEGMEDEEFDYMADKAKCGDEYDLTYDEIEDAWKEQDAKWKKGQYVVLSDSYTNREFGYDGLVGQVIESDHHASHLGYVVVKILNKGDWKDKEVMVECADVAKTAEKDIVKHLVLDAL